MWRALEEERHFNGNRQSVPLGVTKLKIREELHCARHSFVSGAALSIEQNQAGLTGAKQLAAGGLDGRALACKLAKCCERAFLQRWKRGRHISHRSAGRALRTTWPCAGCSPV